MYSFSKKLLTSKQIKEWQKEKNIPRYAKLNWKHHAQQIIEESANNFKQVVKSKINQEVYIEKFDEATSEAIFGESIQIKIPMPPFQPK